MKVGLVACSARKKDKPMMVERLHSNSPLFRYSVEYCKRQYDATYALSAEHGLLPLNKKIKPFNTDLAQLQRRALKDWFEMVAEQIGQTIPEGSELYFYTGKRFRKLIPHLKNFKCYEPMKGAGIGKQLKFFKSYFTNLNKKKGSRHG